VAFCALAAGQHRDQPQIASVPSEAVVPKQLPKSTDLRSLTVELKLSRPGAGNARFAAWSV